MKKVKTILRTLLVIGCVVFVVFYVAEGITKDYIYDKLSKEQERIQVRMAELRVASAIGSMVEVAGTDDISTAKELMESFRGMGIDEEKGVIVVEIEGLSDEKIAAFRKMVSDKEFIEFKEAAINVIVPGTSE